MAIINPIINIDILPAVVNQIVEEQKLLFIGQKTSTGSATAGTLVENIGNNNEQDALFGADSMLAGMVRAAKLYNKVTQMDAIVLADDVGSTASTATIEFAGTATENGTLTFNIGSRENYSFTIDVTDTDTATDIATALVNAINAVSNAPFSAFNSLGVVTVSASNAGTVANDFGLEVQGAVAGVTVTLTAFSGGATDPDLTTPLTLIDDIRYQTIVTPFNYLSQNVFITFVNDRFNPAGDKLLDGVAISMSTDTLSNFTSSTVADNSQNFVTFANKQIDTAVYKGGHLFEINYEAAAQFAAVRALRLTPGTDLSQFVISQTVNRDSTGGFYLSTLPYFNTPFEHLPVIDKDKIWTFSERQTLIDDGWSILGNNRSDKGIIADQIVTRYQTNAAGDPDESFKFLNYVDQASTVRDVFHTTLRQVYAQSRLTDGILVDGFNMTNADDFKAELVAIYELLADNAVVPAGNTAIRTFKNSLTITVDEINGTIDVEMLDPVVTQLRKVNVTMQLTFSLN